MRNTGLDTHRSFNTSKYKPSRPNIYLQRQFTNFSNQVDLQCDKVFKNSPLPRPSYNKSYAEPDYLSPNKIHQSKYEKSKNTRILYQRYIVKNMNRSEKILPKRQQVASSYNDVKKYKFSVGEEARNQLQKSRIDLASELLYRSNVTQYRESYKVIEPERYRYSKYKDNTSENPSIKSINGSDVVGQDYGFEDQNSVRQIESYLTKSSHHQILKYSIHKQKLKSRPLDIDKFKDKRLLDGYLNKNIQENEKQRFMKNYPKIDNIQTERSSYETGFLKKNDLGIRSRKQTRNFEDVEFYKNENSSLKLIPKLQKIQDLKADIASLSTRHPSLYTPAESKIALKDFYVGKMLGHGRFGKVSHAIHKATGTLVALKEIPKKIIKAHKLQNQLTLQIKIQMYLNHPHIVKMFGMFSEKDSIYLILEYMEQGSLYEFLKKKGQLLSEAEVAKIIKQIVLSIRYLHDLNIVHRDIKPQNILISNISLNLLQGICKLADFGWATFCNQRRKTNCGTLDYYAPEILEGQQYDQSVDLWCIGVLTFELLTGKVPFYNASKKETVNKIIKVQKMEFPSKASYQAKDFIEGLLVKQPCKRLCVNKLLCHPFIVKNCSEKY